MFLTPELLLERLSVFANNCRMLIQDLPHNNHNLIYSRQLIRASSSPAANYIEAIEASSSKEFLLRLKITRKEIKETVYWLKLIKNSNRGETLDLNYLSTLENEAQELIKIFSASIITAGKNQQIGKIRK